MLHRFRLCCTIDLGDCHHGRNSSLSSIQAGPVRHMKVHWVDERHDTKCEGNTNKSGSATTCNHGSIDVGARNVKSAVARTAAGSVVRYW